MAVIQFQPSAVPGQAPFTFQATLDGSLYNCTVTWSLFGQRWYVQVNDQNGTLIVLLPMVGSSNAQLLSNLTWSAGYGAGGFATVTTQDPHGYRLGTIVVLNINGVTPTGYNVVAPCYITGPSTFTYPLASDPGAMTVPGQFSYDIDLLRGYFQSSMVWRIQSGNIEISP